MRRATIILILAGIAAAAALPQEPDEPLTIEDLIDATARAAAIFARSAPGIVARETLEQRGRRGYVQILEQQLKKLPKNTRQDGAIAVKLPPEFHTHVVVSDYALGQIGAGRAIHEIRSIITIDGRQISAADEARHALAIGIQSEDDELKHRLLENFERNRLEGAVTDFGQLILLFTAASRPHYTFTMGHKRLLNGVPMIALNYTQISGASGLTVFHERTMSVRSTHGEIWLRTPDLLPLRIILDAETPVTGTLEVRDNAVIDYTPTTFGLAPLHIHHMQFLEPDLLVENDLQYSGYQRLTPGILP
ncbi:MAG TPA: hypothetical protein VHA14_16200 [Bryobacteraceae bacterium]|nr:hypothetical protein [Bryobacteraceae bacterium]